MSSEEEIRKQIRATSKESYILEEMIRLGYWPKGGEMPDDPADEIRRRAQLRKELQALRTEENRAGNLQRQIREMKKQRMLESRERRKENKERREKDKYQRALDWFEKKDKQIVYLGENVSKGLNNAQCDEEKLSSNNLPVFNDEAALAEAMGISVRDLRFLAFNRTVSKVNHYRRFKLKKKSGGERLISAPKSHLKNAQRWILEKLLNNVETHSCVHGFKEGVSIKTNAEVHLACSVLVNIDLENFFPTFTFPRVKGMYLSLGYSQKVATVLALLTTEPDIEELEIDDENWFVATGERFLPQGSPASPAITNIICRSLDKSLTKVSEKLGFVYTRYADDMSFSSKVDVEKAAVGQLMRRVNYIIARSGLKINKKKTKIIRKGGRKEVTGLIVNEEKPAVPKKKLKAFRALLFQIDKDGPEGKVWGNSDNLFEAILGYAHFIKMVDDEKGEKYLEQVKGLISKYGWESATYSVADFTPKPLLREREKPKPPVLPSEKNKSKKKIEASKEAAPSRVSAPSFETSQSQSTEEKKPWWSFLKFW